MRARGSNKKSDDQQHPVVKGEDDDNRKKTITQQAPTSSGSAHSLSSSSAAKPRLVSIDSKSRSIMSTNNVVSTSSPEDRERLLAPSSANDQPSVVVSAQVSFFIANRFGELWMRCVVLCSKKKRMKQRS